jgi:hypothetical protein
MQFELCVNLGLYWKNRDKIKYNSLCALNVKASAVKYTNIHTKQEDKTERDRQVSLQITHLYPTHAKINKQQSDTIKCNSY